MTGARPDTRLGVPGADVHFLGVRGDAEAQHSDGLPRARRSKAAGPAFTPGRSPDAAAGAPRQHPTARGSRKRPKGHSGVEAHSRTLGRGAPSPGIQGGVCTHTGCREDGQLSRERLGAEGRVGGREPEGATWFAGAAAAKSQGRSGAQGPRATGHCAPAPGTLQCPHQHSPLCACFRTIRGPDSIHPQAWFAGRLPPTQSHLTSFC